MTEICKQTHDNFKDRNSVAINKSKTRNNPTVEWNKINWRRAERLTFKLQKRIYQASERGDVKAVRKLQKTLINSWSNKVLAVRRVSCYAAKPDKIALPLFLIFRSHLITISPSFNNLCSNSDNSSTDLNSRCAIYSFAECQTNSIKL